MFGSEARIMIRYYMYNEHPQAGRDTQHDKHSQAGRNKQHFEESN